MYSQNVRFFLFLSLSLSLFLSLSYTHVYIFECFSLFPIAFCYFWRIFHTTTGNNPKHKKFCSGLVFLDSKFIFVEKHSFLITCSCFCLLFFCDLLPERGADVYDGDDDDGTKFFTFLLWMFFCFFTILVVFAVVDMYFYSGWASAVLAYIHTHTHTHTHIFPFTVLFPFNSSMIEHICFALASWVCVFCQVGAVSVPLGAVWLGPRPQIAFDFANTTYTTNQINTNTTPVAAAATTTTNTSTVLSSTHTIIPSAMVTFVDWPICLQAIANGPITIF